MSILRLLNDCICKSNVKRTISQNLPDKRKEWKLFNEKEKLHYSSIEKIREYQTVKLRELLRRALRSEYYRSALGTIDPESFTLEDLKKLPFLDKDIMRRQGDALLTMPKARLYPNASGGSTGQPVRFYQDDNYKENTWATMMITLKMSGWNYGSRIARIWGAPQDKKKIRSLRGRLSLFLQNTRFYDSFDMSEKMMREYHSDMTEFEPEIIVSYASSIFLLAQFLEKNGIKPGYPSIAISSSAETLYPHMRETIERVFNTKVFDKYGSREVSAVAAECSTHQGLHIFMDNVIVEVIDPKSEEEVFDAPGELVITDLNNYGFPFIRYKIGDVGIITREQCPCGRKTMLLKKIMGRTTDNFTMKDGRIVHGEYFTHIFYNVPGIKEFQFVQNGIDEFDLYLVKNKDVADEKIRAIEKEIREVIGDTARLKWHFVSSVPKTPTGKYKFTISKVNPADYWRSYAGNK